MLNTTATRRLFLVFGIFCLSAFAYWNTLSNEFINWDDNVLIVHNNQIRSLDVKNLIEIFTPGSAASFQPFRVLSYAVDYHFWQLNPLGYHLANIFWHCMNVLLVYFLTFSLTQRSGAAGLSSLLFAIHPVHTEAVAWLSGRRDVLSLALMLLAFLSFLRLSRNDSGSLSRRVLYSFLMLGFFALSLLTKPSVVIFPMLLFCFDLCFLPSMRRIRRTLLRYLPLCAVVLMYLPVYLSVARAHNIAKSDYHGGSVFLTMLTMLRTLGEYVLMLIAPRNLSVSYGATPVESFRDGSLWFSVGIVLVLLAAMVLSWKKARIVSFGIGWFFIGLLPVSNLVPTSTIKADRYLYLPSVGYCLVFGWFVLKGWDVFRGLDIASPARKRSLLAGYWVMIGVVIFSFATYTIERNRDWKDSETLWAATLDSVPNHPIALNNLGIIYAERGMFEQAITVFEQLLKTAPVYERLDGVLANLGHAYAQQQAFPRAVAAYRRALELNPNSLEALLGLGQVKQEMGANDEARMLYRQAQERAPRHDAPYYALGLLSLLQGDSVQARDYAQGALERNRLSFNAYELLGDACREIRDTECALQAYQHAEGLEPENERIREKLHRMEE